MTLENAKKLKKKGDHVKACMCVFRNGLFGSEIYPLQRLPLLRAETVLRRGNLKYGIFQVYFHIRILLIRQHTNSHFRNTGSCTALCTWIQTCQDIFLEVSYSQGAHFIQNCSKALAQFTSSTSEIKSNLIYCLNLGFNIQKSRSSSITQLEKFNLNELNFWNFSNLGPGLKFEKTWKYYCYAMEVLFQEHVKNKTINIACNYQCFSKQNLLIQRVTTSFLSNFESMLVKLIIFIMFDQLLLLYLASWDIEYTSTNISKTNYINSQKINVE
eukprot:TRINITY_DN9734_c1_g2_i2.p2 TRINITY_DN9734_c1_g2~~TRINITY_DN9734_c1_g2_i2.p2  ORF type:complete len:271 (-),score=-17.45 TRINITY_DN9734_c1_g2_i2:698-1510(-)